jgi:ribosomal protein S18 acetylase RimI-like enzyme
MGDTAQIQPPEPARPEEREAAFRFLLRHVPAETLPQRLSAALRMLETGELDPAGLLVMRHGSELLGAIAGTVVPGGSGIVWPAQAVNAACEDSLTRQLLALLRQRGACLAQALLPPDEVHLAAPLLRNGFMHITELWYLRHNRELPVSLLDPSSHLRFQTFAESDPAVFRATIQRTFEETLDCPEVTSARPVEDVLIGFHAQGVFNSARWWLVWDGTEPVGVLLTSAVPEEDSWEICYVGVIPLRRRRGIGRELMLKAILEARAAEVGEVFLTVDGRNRPAWDLYQTLGFEAFDRREVFLTLFANTPGE